MAEHPFRAPYDDRDAEALLAAMKLNTRLQLANADEVRNTDLDGQFGGIYVRANRSSYRLDTEDLQEDDGENVIHSRDGYHFLKTVENVAPLRVEYDDSNISGGAITMDPEADVVIVNISSDANLVFPTASDRNGRNINVKKKGSGILTPYLDGSETIDGDTPSDYAITTDGGYWQLSPGTGGYDLLASQL